MSASGMLVAVLKGEQHTSLRHSGAVSVGVKALDVRRPPSPFQANFVGPSKVGETSCERTESSDTGLAGPFWAMFNATSAAVDRGRARLAPAARAPSMAGGPARAECGRNVRSGGGRIDLQARSSGLADENAGRLWSPAGRAGSGRG